MDEDIKELARLGGLPEPTDEVLVQVRKQLADDYIAAVMDKEIR